MNIRDMLMFIALSNDFVVVEARLVQVLLHFGRHNALLQARREVVLDVAEHALISLQADLQMEVS